VLLSAPVAAVVAVAAVQCAAAVVLLLVVLGAWTVVEEREAQRARHARFRRILYDEEWVWWRAVLLLLRYSTCRVVSCRVVVLLALSEGLLRLARCAFSLSQHVVSLRFVSFRFVSGCNNRSRRAIRQSYPITAA